MIRKERGLKADRKKKIDDRSQHEHTNCLVGGVKERKEGQGLRGISTRDPILLKEGQASLKEGRLTGK